MPTVGGEPELRWIKRRERKHLVAERWKDGCWIANRVNKVPIENKLLPEKAHFIRFETHDHVLQSTLGQPAVEEHRDEDVPYGGPEYLWKMRYLAAAGINMFLSC